MVDFSVVIAEASRELTARERIKFKDTGDAIKLDEASVNGCVINPEMFVVLDVHNEKSDNPDYKNYVIVDKSGDKYVTGSASFWKSFIDIWDEMTDAGESDFSIKVYRKDSKNYKGKQFITCSVI